MIWTNDAEDFTFFTTVAVAPDDPTFVVVGGWGWDDDAVHATANATTSR